MNKFHGSTKTTFFGLTVAFTLLGACIAFLAGRSIGREGAMRPVINDAFIAATKVAEDFCSRAAEGCNDLHAVAIYESTCYGLMPQDGDGKGVCGSWTISYEASSDTGRNRSIRVVVDYATNIEHVSEDNPQ